MDKIINKYVYDVTRRLPEKDRLEVEEELKANIYDMLSDNPDEAEVKAVLQELGHPSKLAEQYRQNPRYLISPAMYDQYIQILKWLLPLVGGILAALGFILGSLDVISAASGTVDIKDILKESISQGISMGISGAFQALFWTTLGFVIAERSGYQQKIAKEWKIEDIPEIPKNDKDKISLSETIIEMALSVVFTVIGILICSGIIPVAFSFAHNGRFVQEVFNTSFLQTCVPIFIIILAFSMLEYISKLVYRRWHPMVCTGVIISNIVSAGGFIYLLTRPNIFSREFLNFVETNDWGSHDIMQFFGTGGSNPVIITIIIIIVVVTVATSAHALYKTIRANAR
ncbi:HAAS signaling domain-containing protein [Breznakia pachnodae]|uniref:ABC transporter permease n=1 Tax=Breznakia pachnodae TaxID=265178 RepID=A0ABU0E763_9FIRM|nr:hypothetical protein [Breznakia pachnodae]MDQ0362710.1 hypothetical protein [Breznakia pachnodae]